MLLNKIALDDLLPSHLDGKRQNFRKNVTLVNGGYVLCQFNESGSYIVSNIASKDRIRVDSTYPVIDITFHLPYIISLHCNKKKETLQVYSYRNNKHREIVLNNGGNIEPQKVACNGRFVVIASRNAIYKCQLPECEKV